ncbi:MAG: phenylacetate--CoA ligase family protein [Candidatus Aminicenantes bacterium]|nr:phenylacetate--CoA ligase family protein [Candidatus Aminicenantes bacterium]
MIGQSQLNLNIFWELKKRLRFFPFSWPDIRKFQLERVKLMLQHCYQSFDFYRQRFDRAGFKPEYMNSIEEMQTLPCLTKEEYRDFTSTLVNADPGRYANWFQDGTSGSTGMPLKIYRNHRERAYMLSKYLRTLFLNGYRYRDVTFCLPSPHRMNGNDSFLQRFGFLKRICVPYTAPVERMVERYMQQPVDLLYANRSHLEMMAGYIKENGIEIAKPRLVCSSSEMLDAPSRQLIEEVFGEGRLFEVYGAVEFNNLAFQIIGQKGFHFNHDTSIIELEDEAGRINSKAGHCLITDLWIRSFPLIRYRLDDWIEMEAGEGTPKIKRIVGRSDDWFVLPNGEKKPFHAVYEIMERESGVRRFRFVQQATDEIDVQLVTDGRSDRPALERRLLAALDAEFSHAARFRIQYFEDLPVDPHGKMRMVVSKVKVGRPS